MLKKISIRKITISTISLFAIMLLYLIPSNKTLKIEKELEYVGKEIEGAEIFLMDKNSYIALTNAPVIEKDIEKRARELRKRNIKSKFFKRNTRYRKITRRKND